MKPQPRFTAEFKVTRPFGRTYTARVDVLRDGALYGYFVSNHHATKQKAVVALLAVICRTRITGVRAVDAVLKTVPKNQVKRVDRLLSEALES